MTSSPSFLQILLEGLKTDSTHEVKLRAATRSIYDATRVYLGEFSEPQKLLLRLNCDQAQAFTIVRSSSSSSSGAAVSGLEMSTGVMAGVACVSIALLVALLALAVWR